MLLLCNGHCAALAAQLYPLMSKYQIHGSTTKSVSLIAEASRCCGLGVVTLLKVYFRVCFR